MTKQHFSVNVAMKTLKIELFGDVVKMTEYYRFVGCGKKLSENSDSYEDFQVPRILDSFDEVEVSENSDSNERFAQSIQRARARVRELALCNPWEYFATFTLNEEKQDRFDLDGWVKDFGNWIGNYNRKFNTKLRYLIVPERHKNGAWHGHGLLSGVAQDSVTINEHGYPTIKYYENRFGFISLDKIKDHNKASSYIAKYITKSQGGENLAKCKHMFYSSRGLQGRELVEFMPVSDDYISDWSNEWVGISWRSADWYAEFKRVNDGLL